MQRQTRPSPFLSACNIEKVGVAWERGYLLWTVAPHLCVAEGAPVDIHTIRDQFIIWKLTANKKKKISPRRDSNSRPLVYETSALTTELQRLAHARMEITSSSTVPLWLCWTCVHLALPGSPAVLMYFE